MTRSTLPLLLAILASAACPWLPAATADGPGRAPVPAVLLRALLPVPASLAAQAPSGEAELRSIAGSVADRWSPDRVRTLESVLSPGGVGFHLGATRQASLEPRKVVAALEDLLNRFRSVSCTVVRVTPSAGAGDRGSAELAWHAVATGTSEVLRRTVFLGFAREADRWRISEIRILQ